MTHEEFRHFVIREVHNAINALSGYNENQPSQSDGVRMCRAVDVLHSIASVARDEAVKP